MGYGDAGFGLGLMEGMLLGGMLYSIYLTPFYMRPWYACPPWYAPWYAPPWAYYPPEPWWAREGSRERGGRGRGGRSSQLPQETLPVVIFDAGRVGLCKRLDKKVAVGEHEHGVPMREVEITLQVWEPALHKLWREGRPPSFKSVAAAVVVYRAYDSASFGPAQAWCDAAQLLTDDEVDETRCFSIVLVGDTDGIDDESGEGLEAPTVASSSMGAEGLVFTGPDALPMAFATAAPPKRPREVSTQEALAFARPRGIHALEAPCRTPAQVHAVMASVARLCVSRAVQARARERAKEAARQGLSKALEDKKGMWPFDKVDVDGLWRAIEAGREAGLSEESLAPAQEKLDELLQKGDGGCGGRGRKPRYEARTKTAEPVD